MDALFDTAALLDRLGAEEIRVIRTSESPRWAENGGELCLTIPEYYDALLELISRALDAGLKLRLNLWQFAACHLRYGWYGAAPVLGDRRQYRASIPACRGIRGNVYLSHTDVYKRQAFLSLQAGFCKCPLYSISQQKQIPLWSYQMCIRDSLP